MLKKFLKKVMVIVAGKQAEELADLLDSKKHVNEFVIAKKLDITINQTRNILYKISNYGLVSFIRKKDKRKGWYTYFWKIEILKSLEFLRGILIKRIDQISHQVKSRETKRFYVCERCNIEFNEENALLHNFTCNECGGIFTMKDNTKVLKELNKEKEKIEKIRLKEFKKEEKIVAEKKAAKKLMRKLPQKKKKISKKIAKKKLVKKVVKKIKSKKSKISKKKKIKLKKKTKKR